ncbi:spore coat protein [Natribacillus halophilus]|uniref:Spore coat protein CotF n=1 Tax=Natribacillus halophilus TaxID=549003 RepID=A0A1G8M8I6_9BACI|nr:spore coat protein [Natribacillus halophilus]SDI64276.1 Spore coat protein CotF [Natribacillus halophilus]
MQLAGHEFHELSELTMGCFNTVSCMSTWMKQAQDQELQQLLAKHFSTHIDDYNLKVEFLQDAGAPDIAKSEADTYTPNLASYTESPVTPLPPVEMRLTETQPNDREIATAYLLDMKASAKNNAQGALECANPDLRTALENAYLSTSHHAYEIWQYMVNKGYYPLAPAPAMEIQSVGKIYPVLKQQGVQS